ncbi:RNA polymerase sigma factor [Flavihumibacter petaseus]|uniref:Putative RNA polymerase ECF-type sigma factor n=1 Tax=Flavihumibacter petaseus NBRC 106054 TaxID=1220578 RepID=A0A0E9MXJ9_9BACT|nr:RNA polymerase sigma factor [Flavihumibacter petaseus]GAO42339.1 putative RNA polymerase ECF-type sigma factor [Flavihumibacter petaseus NBRC 106054]
MTFASKETWQSVYAHNIGHWIGVCYRYTGNLQLSEDLAHEAFLKAMEKADKYRGMGALEAWLRRIVVNHVLQYLRDRKKEPSFLELKPDQLSLERIDENNPSPAYTELSATALLDTIGQLPEHHRLVFNLYVLEAFTHAEIAATLGISEGTSKSHLARARKKLQEWLLQTDKDKPSQKADRKAFLLLLAGTGENADPFFRKCFDAFSIPPLHSLSQGSFAIARQPTLGKRAYLKPTTKMLTAVVAGALVISVVWIWRQDKPGVPHPVTANTISGVTEKKFIDSVPRTATISPDSIIEEIKPEKMKPLDSLALMLALTTTTLTTTADAASAEKDSIKTIIEKYSAAAEIAPPTLDTLAPKPAKPAKPATPAIPATPARPALPVKGTFRASEVYWSKTNNEVYFKGDVRVSFEQQNFKGRGSFTFLGKVYLLVVDDKPVIPGGSQKLAQTDYELVTLNTDEAIAKYGDKGKNGAVEISRSR